MRVPLPRAKVSALKLRPNHQLLSILALTTRCSTNSQLLLITAQVTILQISALPPRTLASGTKMLDFHPLMLMSVLIDSTRDKTRLPSKLAN